LMAMDDRSDKKGETLLEKMRAVTRKGGDGEDADSIRARIADIAKNMGAVGKMSSGLGGGLAGAVTLLLDSSGSMDMRLDGGYGNYFDPSPVRADGTGGVQSVVGAGGVGMGSGKARTKWEQLLEIVQVVQGASVDADLNWFHSVFYSGKDDGGRGTQMGGGVWDDDMNIDKITNMPTRPGGGTNMALAFKEMKKRGKTNFVLVTDGEPDNEREALFEAQGCTISILYVGPMPRPRFLDELAGACGGYIESDDMLSIEGSVDRIMELAARNW
jgi:hypothetical protein